MKAWSSVMCGTCKSIDDEITRYRLLGDKITDQQTLNGISLLIEKMEGQKRQLHPGQYVCADQQRESPFISGTV
jgi:hypothetical protein